MCVIVLTLILCDIWPLSDLSESRNYLSLCVCGKEEKECKSVLEWIPACEARLSGHIHPLDLMCHFVQENK